MTTGSRLLLTKPVPYVLPSWCSTAFTNPPANGRLRLANLPTPVYQVNCEAVERIYGSSSFNLFVKRDDATGGLELGGNKVRKLEFLLADALDCDAIVTIGGAQSNHCRATAAAARMLGIHSPHLILRTSNDIGLVGNILIDRMIDSNIYTCTPGEYGRIGSEQLLARLGRYLQDNEIANTPYLIPVGGSNGIGTWGYINAVDELLQQMKDTADLTLDAIVMACGSGGTTAGITLGIALAYAAMNEKPPMIYAVGVCDSPDYFYNYIAGIAQQMGLKVPTSSNSDNNDNSNSSSLDSITDFVKQHLTVIQGKGRGYAVNTPEETQFVADFARNTGIVLDPVYTGKAMYSFSKYVAENPLPDNSNVLFWHTGGTLGLYDKVDELLPLLQANDAEKCQRLDIYGKNNGIDISKAV